MSKDDVIIGIDLGTTNSLCAIFENGEPTLIPNALEEMITPSVIAVVDGKVLVGSAAKEHRVVKPENCAWVFKRWMGSERKIDVANKTFTPIELSSLILQSLKHDAEAYLKTEVKEAVISVPAYFNDQQRKATKLAGELAGLKVRRIVNEPTAAALTYGFHERDSDKKILVLDLGGGTFDVTLMEIFEGTLEIIASSGESFLGGEDFTNRLASWALQEKGINYETAELKTPLLVSRLREECERAKKRLSSKENVVIRIPDKKGKFDQNETVKLNKIQFEDICKPLSERILAPIMRTLRDARVQPETIDEIILVGGATRMSLINDLSLEHLLREPLCKFNPDEVVALGTAVQAALIKDDKSVNDLVMTDVCPFTLGIDVVKEIRNHVHNGYYLPIIHRNTTIPISREEVVQTIKYGQREMSIRVYQGEARRIEGNLYLGELKVKNIPPGPAGKNVHIRFTYDINGILDVEAVVPETGAKFQTVLTNHVKGLSEKEIQKAVKKLQKLKFYPRDDVANQKLLRYGEKIIAEINRFERQSLEQALDQFEDAMSSGEKEYFDAVKEQLLILLSSLGHTYEPKNEKENLDDKI